MKRPKNYTYELIDGKALLHSVRRKLEHQEEAPWKTLAPWMPFGHVEYQPIRNNPVRSGLRFIYQKAGLNLLIYFPENIFNQLLELLDREKVLQLKSAFQASIPERSGYVIQEFKIRGFTKEDLSDSS